MTDKIKFSIIVPIYNMEQYLGRCLDSIINQDYDCFEVICVNDGSKDRSQQILEEYADKDGRIVVVNKTNAGLGMARNTGLENAKGDYVWFVDSDDWIEKGALSRLALSICNTSYLNTYVIDMIQTDGSTYQRTIQSCHREQGVLSSDRYAKDLMLYNALFFAQNKIYKYDFIKDYQFNTGFYEDVPQIVLFGQKQFDIFVLHEPLYYYYAREGSIMKTVDNRVLDIFKQVDTVREDLYKNKEYQRYCTHLFYYSADRTYKSIKKANKKDLLNDYAVIVKKKKGDYLKPTDLFFFNELSWRRKLRLFLSLKKYLSL